MHRVEATMNAEKLVKSTIIDSVVFFVHAVIIGTDIIHIIVRASAIGRL
jgi:hypothetical protein